MAEQEKRTVSPGGEVELQMIAEGFRTVKSRAASAPGELSGENSAKLVDGGLFQTGRFGFDDPAEHSLHLGNSPANGAEQGSSLRVAVWGGG